MAPETRSFLMRNSVFAWIAFATGAVLLVPLIWMQVSASVDWDARDFLVMGVLLFGTGSTFVLVARKVPRKYRAAVAATCAVALLYVWAELAVGVFTDLGS
ncbi:hypothetical protein [Frateuria soli]|uniref:hypothetical protein n=1 Tax=Frateuria soli TaxID=1542730 RepID=UPI001E4ADF95|nr:hypothetical protein [Frateuria soli]UGB37678.1 hypothetical protein LQ771_12715 [Frateuria soli]